VTDADDAQRNWLDELARSNAAAPQVPGYDPVRPADPTSLAADLRLLRGEVAQLHAMIADTPRTDGGGVLTASALVELQAEVARLGAVVRSLADRPTPAAPVPGITEDRVAELLAASAQRTESTVAAQQARMVEAINVLADRITELLVSLVGS